MDNQTPSPNPTPPTENIPPQNPAAETPPAPKKPFLTGKIILLIVTLLILFGASGTYLALNSKPQPIVSKVPLTLTPAPTVDPTANWKTYENNKYGFEFKYRPDLILEEKNNRINLEYRGSLSTYYEKLFGTSITIENSPTEPSLKEHARKELCKGAFKLSARNIDQTDECLSLVERNLKDYKNKSIVGIQTIYNLFENPIYTILFSHKDKLITVRSTGETGGGPTDLGIKTIDQILSTFKFTETSPAPTCRPRPACLDATPKCLIEIPDMCPPTITPSQ